MLILTQLLCPFLENLCTLFNYDSFREYNLLTENDIFFFFDFKIL